METELVEILPPTRFCFIPNCSHNSNRNRNMVFVPLKSKQKKDWCVLVGRTCPQRQLFCCEMHLDLETDLENYEKWKCESGYPVMSSTATLKWSKPFKSQSAAATASTSTTFSSPQVHITHMDQVIKYDKIIQAEPMTQDKSTYCRRKTVSVKNFKRKLEHEEESTTAAETGSSYDCNQTESSTQEKLTKVFSERQFFLETIQKNPLMYVGVSNHMFYIIEDIVEVQKTCSLNIIITLLKLRQGDTLCRLSHQFQISRNRIQKIFYETTVMLSSYFQNFIITPSITDIKRNLPYAFKIRYSNVQMIIDCFEIGIEKPSNPVRQAQTWSAYKSCNTIKYLVGATPSGLITFISNGYGGRISDKAITVESKLIDYLPTNAVLMADRGFKEIESLLGVKNIKLLRPPSVYSNTKPTKQQVLESKVIASLRIHIERVIRRLREFRILKPHSVINHKHVPYLDEYVTIACGLCNIQSSLIKNQ